MPVVKMKVPIAKTYFDARDFEIIQEPLKNGWVVQGKYVAEFERTFAAEVGASHAVAVTSGTAALHLALAALGIQAGDEVIVPSFTWIATANAVEYVGATPVFCDINLDTFNIDVEQIEQKITKRTRAIIPVHLFGLSAEMDDILEIAKRYDIALVEDAACGFGAYYNERHVGDFGDVGCFSFHPRKAITTGEGGMLTTSNPQLAELLRSLRNHGASTSDYDRHNAKRVFLLSEYNHLGYNYRMTDIQGALGVAQMEKVTWIQEQRKAKAQEYDRLLADVNFLSVPVCPKHMTHGYQSYVCMFRREDISLDRVPELNRLRNNLMVALEEQGVSTRQGTHAVTMQNYYAEKYSIAREDYPNAWIADNLTVALPLYPQITEEEQVYVVDNLIQEYGGLR